MPRPDHRRRHPFTAAVYAPLPGGLPDPTREYWVDRPGYYQQIDLARAYTHAERLPVGTVVVVDMRDRLGRVRRAGFVVATVHPEGGLRWVDPVIICDVVNCPELPDERPRQLRRSLSPPL